ncbi:hypothetical protein [Leptospira terpstrae]|uniref:hypothetical protein n=1 Tax=Leptospira terpstrae TaxID=293075 RepID=UPI003D06FB21
MGTTTVVAFKYLKLISPNIIIEYGLYIGSASKVILLSITLADRTNIMKEEKEIAPKKQFCMLS